MANILAGAAAFETEIRAERILGECNTDASSHLYELRPHFRSVLVSVHSNPPESPRSDP
jgi:hypothetical protein